MRECLRMLAGEPRATSTTSSATTISGTTAAALIRRGLAWWDIRAAKVTITEEGRKALALEGTFGNRPRRCTCGAGIEARAILHDDSCEIPEAIRTEKREREGRRAAHR